MVTKIKWFWIKPVHMMMTWVRFFFSSTVQTLFTFEQLWKRQTTACLSSTWLHDYTHTQCPTTHTWDMSTHLMVNGLLYLLPDFTTTLPSLSLKSRETMYSKTFTYLEVNSCVQNKTKTSLVITYQTEQFSILGSFLCVLRIWRRKKNYFEKCLYVRL